MSAALSSALTRATIPDDPSGMSRRISSKSAPLSCGSVGGGLVDAARDAAGDQARGEARRPEGQPDHGARHRPHRRVVADGVRHVVDVEVMPREGPADHDPAVAMALDEDDLAQPWRVARPPASVRVRALGALDVIEGEHRELPGVLALAPRRERRRRRGLRRSRRGRAGPARPPPPTRRAARPRGAGRAPSTGAARRRRPPAGSSRGRRGRRATRRPTLRGRPLPSRSAPPGPAAEPAPRARRALPG